MYGAIAGDIIGSSREFTNEKGRGLPFFVKESAFTDDTVLTLATADALYGSKEFEDAYARYFKLFSNSRMLTRAGYVGPGIGFGAGFAEWGLTPERVRKPYNSYGNGSAMRCSPVGWYCKDLYEALVMAQLTASPTHNHIEGIKGAQSVVATIFLARCGIDKSRIQSFIDEFFNYDTADQDLDWLHENYTFDPTCPGSVPQALACCFQASSYTECIDNCLYIGGDTDTVSAIAGSCAEAFFGIPNTIKQQARAILEHQCPYLLGLADQWELNYDSKTLDSSAAERMMAAFSKIRNRK